MMTITVQCPECGKGYRVGDEKAGKRMKCKECDGIVSIPAADEEYGTDEGDDEFDDPQPARRRRASGNKPRKQAKKKSSAFTSPIQLAIGGVIAVATVGIVLFILNQRGIVGGDANENDVAAKTDSGPLPGTGPLPGRRVQLPGPQEGNAAQNGASGNPKKAVFNWTTFSPQNKAFSVEFPAEPQLSDTKSPKSSPRKTFKSTVGDTEYLLNYMTRPVLRRLTKSEKVEALAKVARAQKRESITTLEFSGQPAIEFETLDPFGHRRFHRACFVDNRVYEWMVTGRKSTFDTVSASRFLNSFKLLKTEYKSESSPILITAEQLTREFRENPTAAKTKYFTREITLTGRVIHIDNRFFGNSVLTLVGSDGYFITCTVEKKTKPEKVSSLKDLPSLNIRHFQSVTITGKRLHMGNPETVLALMDCHSLKAEPYVRPASPPKSVVLLDDEKIKLAKDNLDEYKKYLNWHSHFPRIKSTPKHNRPILVEGIVKNIYLTDPTSRYVDFGGDVATVELKDVTTGTEFSCGMVSLDQIKSFKAGDRVRLIGTAVGDPSSSKDIVRISVSGCSLYSTLK